MKKFSLVFAGLLAFLLTGCLSAKVTNFDYKERATLGTPENSVIFIGFYGNDWQMYWSQCDSEYPPDYQQLEGPYIISAPVAPGSRYRLEWVSGSANYGRVVYYWNDVYPMQYKEFDIKVPEKPGIYYFGYYSGQDSFKEGENVPMTGLFATTNPKKQEIECLQEALRKYKGTEWEPVIQSRLKEVK